MNKRSFAKFGIRRRAIDALLSPASKPLGIDRRTFMIGAATAVALQSPTSRAADRVLNSPIRVKKGIDGQIVSVTVGGAGQGKWTIDVAQFAGNPSISVSESGGDTIIQLKDALLPGTSFRTDFAATVSSGLLSRQIQIEWQHAGVGGAHFAVRGDLDKWLKGDSALMADLDSEQVYALLGAAPLSSKCAISATSTGKASFTPDGVLATQTSAEVSLLSQDFAASALSIGVVDGNSLLNSAKDPYTVFNATLQESFNKDLRLESRTGWTVEGSRKGAADLQVELHPSGGCAALVSGGAVIAAAKAHGQVDLGLTDLKSLYADDGHGYIEGLIANIDEGGCWVDSPGCGVELGPLPGNDSFVLIENGKGSMADIGIGARRFALSLDDAVVSTADFPYPVALEADPQTRGTRTGGTQVRPPRIDPQIRQPRIPQIQIKPNRVIGTLNLPTRIDIVRREDMLALSFEFVNMRFDIGGQRVVKNDANKPSYMIVTFPPQSIAEKTFFENETGGPMPTDLPPVPSRVSGHTRLTFYIPTSVPYVLFSLKGEDGNGAKGLLDWSKLTPSVVPTAYSGFGTGPIRIQSDFVHPADKTQLKPRMIFRGLNLNLPDKNEEERPPATNRTGGAARVIGGLLGGQRRRTDPETSGNTAKPEIQILKGGLDDLIPNIGRGINPALTYRIIPHDRIPVIDNPLYTCIEMPVRLIISPNEQQGWVHTFNPATSPTTRRTELWHTRLANKRGDGLIEGQKMAIRAVDAVDYEKSLGELFGNSQFDQAMMRQDRIDLVQNMVYRAAREDTLPFWADRVILTPLGGYLKGEGNWEWTYIPKKKLSHLITWTHNSTLGRDHFVKIVTRGYLFPTGHPAAQVSISERKIANTSAGPVAYLRKRTFVIVREPTVTFSEAEQRQLGFKSITMLTKETPPLSPDADIPGTNNGNHGFWTLISTGPFPMHVQAEDCDGRKVQLSMPLIYLDQSKATDPTFIASLITYYEKSFSSPDDPKHPRRHDANGQKMAFAPAGDSSESTSLPVDELFFTAVATAKPPADQDRGAYRCILKCAKVKIGAAEYLAGTSAPPPIEVELPAVYKSGGFGASNAAKAFLQITKNMPAEGVGLAFGDASKSGGLVNPDQKITAFLKGRGPVGGKLSDALTGTANPKDFLPDTAKILGAVSLWELLPDSIPITPGDPKDPKTMKSPRLELKIDKDSDGKPQKARVEFTWRPEIKSWPSSDPIFVVKKAWSTSYFPLELLGKVEVDLKSGGDSFYEFTGVLRNFDIDCIAPASFIILHFDELKFTAKSGEGAKVTMVPEFPKTTFTGPLTFVQKFQDLIGQVTGGSELLASTGPGLARLEGFEFTPFMDVTPQMIRAGFKLGVPNLAFGAFTIENMALSAEVQLPLLGDSLRVKFAFCERSSPFRLSVMGFAGGGFMSITLSPSGIEILEASFEFGGSLALDIGVASGGVSVMAGIYFKMTGDDCFLEGYIRLNGRLSVLGIIRISVEFYLSLSYDSASGNAIGTARVTVEIEILFFSMSVSLTVQRKVAGSGGSAELMASNEEALALAQDARFTKSMSEQQWKDRYCAAFA